MKATGGSRLRRTVLASLVFWTLQGEDALAYIDPGSGSLLLQLLFGGVVGALAIVKLYWNRLRIRLFGSRREDPAEGENEGGRPS